LRVWLNLLNNPLLSLTITPEFKSMLTISSSIEEAINSVEATITSKSILFIAFLKKILQKLSYYNSSSNHYCILTNYTYKTWIKTSSLKILNLASSIWFEDRNNREKSQVYWDKVIYNNYISCMRINVMKVCINTYKSIVYMLTL